MRRLVVGLAMAAAAVIAPAWALAGDQEIADEIVKQLRERKAAGELVGFGIDLEIDRGTVWLKGHVASQAQEKMVLEIARRVDGVEEVVNDMTIQEEKPQAKTSLLSPLKSLAPKKSLFGSLRGSKEDQQAVTAQAVAYEDLAEQAAPQAEPAVARTNQISDEQIAQAVIARLREEQQRGTLRGFSIDVSVDHGSLWLKGSVANAEQHTLVLEAARRIPGVTQVVNDLSVGAPGIVATPVSQPVAARPISQAASSRLQPTVVTSAQPGQPTPAAPAPFQPHGQTPVAFAPAYSAQPVPLNVDSGIARARYDHPQMPGYAWPSYAAYPNYGAVTYPKQYSPAAWPYIGPFYPYPQVPLGWRKVTLEWDDGWWFLDFKSK